jgi:23S rRNA (cytosine1962-C5)-methyltransferase
MEWLNSFLEWLKGDTFSAIVLGLLVVSEFLGGFEYLKQMPDDFDIVILDPPAFAKNLRATHNALVAYKRLNAMALKKMKPGSKLLTFSCSQHITAPLFADAVRAAAIEVGKSVQIIGHFTQPEDHPNNIFHPEGQYLKGLLLQLT